MLASLKRMARGFSQVTADCKGQRYGWMLGATTAYNV
jgi:hypothetical protein